jgi:molybdopterin-guanine dinucleotide biosynthesis protein A
MSRRHGVSAIVLAGGRSSRFGRDKLAEPLDGRPLLGHAIDAVRPLADEILVVVAPDASPALPDGVRLVHDRSAFEGPLVALVSGSAFARHGRILVVGGDMPSLRAPVLAALLAALDDEDIAAAMLDHDGDVPPLPMAFRPSVALPVLRSAIDAGERRLRAVARLLPTAVLAEEVWRRLDPAGATVVDIDTPADLA